VVVVMVGDVKRGKLIVAIVKDVFRGNKSTRYVSTYLNFYFSVF